MANVIATHSEQIGPNRVRHVIHFTRMDMLCAYAEGAKKTAKDLPSNQIEVYQGEDCVIVERNLT